MEQVVLPCHVLTTLHHATSPIANQGPRPWSVWTLRVSSVASVRETAVIAWEDAIDFILQWI